MKLSVESGYAYSSFASLADHLRELASNYLAHPEDDWCQGRGAAYEMCAKWIEELLAKAALS